MSIKKMVIRGLKKFKKLEIEFNNEYSVLIGENEIGKSTILLAIDIVLNQANFYNGSSSLIRFLNDEMINEFFENPSLSTLPNIEIELFLELEKTPNNLNFCGLHYEGADEPAEGIKFEFKFNEEFKNDIDLKNFAENNIIPIEYYVSSWKTFQGRSYFKKMLPFKFIFIDNSTNKKDVFGSYAKNIYNNKINVQTQRELSANFNQTLSNFKEQNVDSLQINDFQSIGFESSKVEIEKLLDIYEGNISIKDMGRGKENLIRTELAINNDIFDLILIDEPENHLSYTNTRKLIEKIKESTGAQIIIASHSSLIISRLNLNNTILIGNKQTYPLTSLSKEANEYFKKIDNLDVLRFILAEKVILVEGAAEYIIINSVFQKIYGVSLDSKGIDIISLGSLSHEKYIELAEVLKNKKVAILKDNDKKDNLIFEEKDNFKYFVEEDSNIWTLEVAFYNENTVFFDEMYINKKTKAEYKEEEMPKAQAHMLKNKTDNALLIENHIDKLIIPKKIEEALEWISE